MRVDDILPVVSFAAGFAADGDEAYKYLHFVGGLVCASSGSHGAVARLSLSLGSDVVTPAAQLVRALKSLGGRQEVELALTKARLTVKSGKFRSQLPVVAVEDQAYVTYEVPAAELKLDEAFWSAMAAAQATAATSPTEKMAHRGVYWSPDGTLMSTDGVRITMAQSGVGYPAPEGAVVPVEFLRLAKGAWPAAAVDERGALWLVEGERGAWTTLVAADFPAKLSAELLAGCRARSKAATCVDLREAPLDVLDRVLVAADDASHRVVVTLEPPRTVRLAVTENAAGVSAEDVMDLPVSGSRKATFAVNGQHLRHAFRSYPTMYVAEAALTPLYFSGNGRDHILVTMVM